MKRIASLLVLLLAVVAPLTANAGTKLRVRTLGWHSTIGAGYSQGDSLTNVRDGSNEASVEAADTTAAFSTHDWVMPGPIYTTAVASDSVAWLRVSFFPVGTTPAVTADSLHISVQVSENGTAWTSAVFTGPKISPIIAAMGAAAVIETGTANTFVMVLRQIIGGATESIFDPLGTGAPTDKQIYGYPFVRFIVRGDHSGTWAIKLVGFANETDPN